MFGLLAGGLTGWLTGELAFGLTFGLLFGLAGEAWPAFIVGSGLLMPRRRFPWRSMAFLEDSYRLGLLRVAGSAYQFRHAGLQDHLAP